MLQSDFNDEHAMRQHAASLYEKSRQARRSILRLDTKHDSRNRIIYKSAIQWLDSIIEELQFEEEPKVK
jgi:hypothetical protein